MSIESNPLNRRNFLTLSAAAGAGIVAATALPDAAAAGLAQAAPILIKPKPLADKIYTTEAAGISRKTHDEHFKLYTGYVNKVNEIRTKLAALGVPDPTKANATFIDFGSARAKYLDAFLNVIDWDAVNANFAVAQTMLKAGK